MVSFVNTALHRIEPECDEWRAHAFVRIAAEHPNLVVISNNFRYSLVIGDKETNIRSEVIQAWGQGLSATLARLDTATHAVAVIGDVPGGYDVPSCLSQHPDDFGACSRPLSAIPTGWHTEESIVASASPGATFIDPTPWLCDPAGCPAVIGHYIAYWDVNHLTQPFAASLAPELDAALSPLISSGAPASVAAGPSSVPSAPAVGSGGGVQAVLSDTFSRNVSAGWGQPDGGPAWITGGGKTDGVRVDGTTGRLSVGAAADGRFESVPVADRDIAIGGRWALDALPVAASIGLHFWPRVAEGGSQYRFYLTVDPSGNVFASFSATAGSQTSVIAPPRRVATGYVPGDWWWVRVEASGTNPTNLRSRVWKDGTTEPSTWTQDLTDASPTLQASGNAVEIGIWNGPGETTLPLGARFDDITIESQP
jgi:hypothetical protein